jgi:hypothetical protein
MLIPKWTVLFQYPRQGSLPKRPPLQGMLDSKDILRTSSHNKTKEMR